MCEPTIHCNFQRMVQAFTGTTVSKKEPSKSTENCQLRIKCYAWTSSQSIQLPNSSTPRQTTAANVFKWSLVNVNVSRVNVSDFRNTALSDPFPPDPKIIWMILILQKQTNETLASDAWHQRSTFAVAVWTDWHIGFDRNVDEDWNISEFA